MQPETTIMLKTIQIVRPRPGKVRQMSAVVVKTHTSQTV